MSRLQNPAAYTEKKINCCSLLHSSEYNYPSWRLAWHLPPPSSTQRKILGSRRFPWPGRIGVWGTCHLCPPVSTPLNSSVVRFVMKRSRVRVPPFHLMHTEPEVGRYGTICHTGTSLIGSKQHHHFFSENKTYRYVSKTGNDQGQG